MRLTHAAGRARRRAGRPSPRAAASASGAPAAEAAAAAPPDVAPPPDAPPALVAAPLADALLAMHVLDSGGGGDGGDGAGGPPEGGGGGDGQPPPAGWGPLAALAAGARDRAAADPDFWYKVGVEVVLDAAIIVGVNIAGRRQRFLPEIEFTASQVAVSVLCDFALVYLLAPTASAKRTAVASSAAAMAGGQFAAVLYRARARLARLPAHALQPGPFSVGDRLALFACKVREGEGRWRGVCRVRGQTPGLTPLPFPSPHSRACNTAPWAWPWDAPDPPSSPA